MSDELRKLLENKTRAELNMVAKKLQISGATRLRKADLVAQLLSTDTSAVRTLLTPSWWDKYHNHVYGLSSIIGVVLAVAFFVWPLKNSNDVKSSETATSAIQVALPPFSSRFGEPFSFNSDIDRLDEILASCIKNSNLDFDRSVRIDVRTLEQLFRERFADPTSRHNYSPTMQEILFFMQKHPEVIAVGYKAGFGGDTIGVNIDQLIVDPSFATTELKLSFVEFCKEADELELSDGLRAWWD